MIDTENIALRRRGEPGSNISKNPLSKHKDTVRGITTVEKFEELAQYIVDENEVIGIVEKPFVLEELLETNENPFILDLLEPAVLKFREQSPVHNLQEVPWNYGKPVLLIRDIEVPKEEVAIISRSEKIMGESKILAQSKAKENVLPSKPTMTEKKTMKFLKLLKRSEFKVME